MKRKTHNRIWHQEYIISWKNFSMSRNIKSERNDRQDQKGTLKIKEEKIK